MNVMTESLDLPIQEQDRRTIAEFLTDAFVLRDSSGIPDAVIDRAVLCFIDTIGVALAAAGLEIGTAASRVALKSSTGPCTVWGTGKGACPTDAALANGMLSHALDFDDTHAAAIMHTSCMVVPTTLALGQAGGHDGRTVVAAAVVGYEIAGRLGRLAPGPFQDNGFQATSVLGVFASTGAAARLLGLDRDQTINAFGIAGSMASGLMEYLANGSDVKQLHAGWAAQAGIRAVQLAAEGFTGPSTVFEGRFGVFRSFARRDVSAADVIEFAPGTWEVELMGPKPYPACLCVHPLVQSVQDIKTRLLRQGGTVADIVRLHCYVPQWYVNLVFEPAEGKAAPATPYEARFSAPYCIARVLLDDRLTLGSFAAGIIGDSAVAELAALISYEVEALPEFPDAFPARVVATLASGDTIESYTHHNLGSPGNPFAASQYDDKFLSATKACLAPQQAQELLLAIKQLARPGGMEGFSRAMGRLTLTG